MSLALVLLFIAFGASAETRSASSEYSYNWESLKQKPVPEWFEDAKFGIFIHWGPYSVIGHRKGDKGYAEHVPKLIYQDPKYYYPYMADRFGAHPPEFGYKDVIPLFKAENWDPDEWAELFAMAGARYIVPTAEHHDGYAMWDSDLTAWCATKVGPMRDLIGELGKAVRERGMKYAPSYHRERHPGFFAKHKYATDSEPRSDISKEIERMPEAAALYGSFEFDDAFIADYVARWKEIERKYQPDLMWIDHIPSFHKRWNRQADDPQIAKFRNACMRMIADYFNTAEQWGKDVYVNNKGPNEAKNWPDGVGFREKDNYNPQHMGQKWQNPATLGTSYGYMQWEEANDAYKSPAQLVHLLCDVVSKNGNLLLNIGPRPDGTLPEGMRTRLLAIGEWLQTNGEAIYGTRPWVVAKQMRDKNNPDLAFTTKDNTLYAIALEQPDKAFLISLPAGQETYRVSGISLLGSTEAITWDASDGGIRIIPPDEWPGKHAWTFRIERIAGKPLK